MKTRIIQTRFWKDEFIVEADLNTQHLYLYLLTSEHINISGYFQLPDFIIKGESKLNDKEYESAKKNLCGAGKAYFYKGWVFVPNAMKNNNYVRSPDNMMAYERELSRIPAVVLDYFRSIVDSSVYSTVDSTKKQEIINKKQETRNKKQEKSMSKEMMMAELRKKIVSKGVIKK